MTLEEHLRQVFAAQVEDVYALDDPAGRAIRRANTVRRRRTVGAGLSAALVVLLSLGGTIMARTGGQSGEVASGTSLELPPTDPPTALPSGPQPAATPLTTSPPVPRVSPDTTLPPPVTRELRQLGVDLRVGDELWTATGKRLALTGADRATRVYQVPEGWVYSGDNQVWLLRPDGVLISLGNLGHDWLLSPDGTRVASVSGPRLSVYRFGREGMLGDAGVVTVPDDVRLVAFAGRHVVISAGDGRIGTVLPDGAEGPVWTKLAVTVFGAVGEDVVGAIDKGETACLTRFVVKAGELTPVEVGVCDLPSGGSKEPTGNAPAVLAPDGGWLAGPMNGDFVLAKVPDEGTDDKPVNCPIDLASAVHTWADNTTLVAYSGRKVLTCRTNGRADARALPTELMGTDWTFVPRLTAPSR